MTASGEQPLRRGWTTGACATAAATAAYQALLTGRFPDPVTVRLPGGQAPAFPLARESRGPDWAAAAVIKDAGDDPDVTHGALVQVTVRRHDSGGLRFRAGDGVGTVSRAGLPLAVGEAAINPAPRRMIAAALQELAAAHGDTGNVEVEVAIPGGRAMAARTMNGRLGIVGGLSVLGTTGVVIPYSCAAWIASIHRGVDVARANGVRHAAAATGSTSEAAVKRHFDLDDMALIDMGDFAGGLLKYLRRHPLPRLTIAGGFAKLGKLAQGHMDLHSGRSSVDFAWLAALATDLGAKSETAAAVAAANTALEALQLTDAAGLDLPAAIAAEARRQARTISRETTPIDVMVIGRGGETLAVSG